MLPPAQSVVRVELPGRTAHGYNVLIGHGVLATLGPAARSLCPGSPRAMIISDDGLPAAIVSAVSQSLANARFAVTSHVVPAGELSKSLARAGTLLAAMAQAGLQRTDLVIAVGGGMVGDLAGFAAAAYMRGIPFIQCPTTLLAMVDASVGGKTGINLDAGTPSHPDLRKNLIGAFHQPLAVFSDGSVLSSLPDRELRSGLAECIKHGLIASHANDSGLLAWTAANMTGILSRDPALLRELVARNVAVKARIVEGDEREAAPDKDGGRALLNLGHTFGHAIELLTNLSPDNDDSHAPLLHGEAVAIGLLAAARCSVHLRMAPEALITHLKEVLTAAGLPTTLRGLPTNAALIEAMGHDKKAISGVTRVVLPLLGGRAAVAAPPAEALAAGWSQVRA